MTPERYQRVKELFLQLVDLDLRERDSFLDNACGQDRDLRREVESLLTYDSDETMIDRAPDRETLSQGVEGTVAARRPGSWWRWRRLTRYLSPRGQLALGAVVAALVLVLMGSIVELSIGSFQRTLRAAALKEILDAKIAGLEMWIGHEQEKVGSWARSNELRTRIKQLVDLAADGASAEMLRASPLQDRVREEISRLGRDKVSYQIWDRNHVTLADEPEMLAIGSGVTPFGGAALAAVFAGESRLLTYDRDRRLTETVAAYQTDPHAGTLAPVRGFDDKIIAALLIVDHDAIEQVDRIFRLADLGTTGETYAFNNDGELLTESRFNDQLRKIGLIPDRPDAVSTRVVHLRDPGVDLTKGFRPEEPLDARPLTKMAQFATAEIDGVDVHGYRDYRGVMVVGAWRWLDKYHVGVATELDKGEMEPGLWLFVVQAWVILGLFVACLGVLGYSYYSLNRVRNEAGQHTQIGKYTLEEKIGEGGMGRVFRARHAHLKRPTAVKLLKPELLDQASIARFEREAQLASQLTHPNTIQIYDYGVTDEGLFYYVMEYVDGPSLAEEVEQRGPLATERAIHVLKQACGSLIEAHAAGLIHRDLKPQNMMLCHRGGISDVVKVVDFGLVKHVQTEESRRITTTGLLAGTPLYIAPERLREPNSAEATIDIYSLGAVAYLLLTGRDVFIGKTIADLLYQTMNVEPPRPADQGAEIPADLDQLVVECLAKQPADRPASVTQLLERLLHIGPDS